MSHLMVDIICSNTVNRDPPPSQLEEAVSSGGFCKLYVEVSTVHKQNTEPLDALCEYDGSNGRSNVPTGM